MMIPMILIVVAVIVFGARMTRKQNAASMERMGSATKRDGGREVHIPDVRFDDVAGIDEVVESLQDLLVFLTEPERSSGWRQAPARRDLPRPSRHRQDAAGEGAGRRGGRAVLPRRRLGASSR